jgi:serine/threonine protein kinase
MVSMTLPEIPRGSQVGPFVIDRMLSKVGNMSSLYAGVVRSTKRAVAIKIARSDDDAYTNFIKDEVEQLSQLRHPGIVHVHPIVLPETGRVVYIGRASTLRPLFGGHDPWYYAMELITGGSLHHHLKTIIQFPIEWKLELIYRIALNLHYMHLRGVAHLDLKLDNILLRSAPVPNEAPQPVLIDFGTTIHYDRKPYLAAGTLLYSSPERVEVMRNIKGQYDTTQRKHVIDHRPSDVWALGVMAYELLEGGYPFRPYTTEEELALNILYRTAPPMRRADPRGETGVQRIVLGLPTRQSPLQGDTEQGMLSKVRENRLTMEDVIHLLDSETNFTPPRI